MIFDEVKIYLKAGDGGEGSTSSMKFSSRRVIGGGGDGGRGGDVIFKVSPHMSDLVKFNDKKRIIAENGERGKEYNKKGKHGEVKIIYVPKGTEVVDLDGNVIIDLNQDEQEYFICRGGNGGVGNHKKLYSLPAEKGEEKEVILYYCIPNDVVIVGFANTGKTSLFNALTGKAYKIADYPYTTTSCVWAPVEFKSIRFTVMDTPAIKKESPNIYAQNWFLKHLFRSKIILFVSDNLASSKEDFALLKKEIAAFDKALVKGKKNFYLLNKVDKIDKSKIDHKTIIPISTTDHTGIDDLKKKIIKTLHTISLKAQAKNAPKAEI
ncbi:MAG: GTPase [Candidatus Omnitrophota bacterium]|jgi:GTP-binding protein